MQAVGFLAKRTVFCRILSVCVLIFLRNYGIIMNELNSAVMRVAYKNLCSISEMNRF